MMTFLINNFIVFKGLANDAIHCEEIQLIAQKKLTITTPTILKWYLKNKVKPCYVYLLQETSPSKCEENRTTCLMVINCTTNKLHSLHEKQFS